MYQGISALYHLLNRAALFRGVSRERKAEPGRETHLTPEKIIAFLPHSLVPTCLCEDAFIFTAVYMAR